MGSGSPYWSLRAPLLVPFLPPPPFPPATRPFQVARPLCRCCFGCTLAVSSSLCSSWCTGSCCSYCSRYSRQTCLTMDPRHWPGKTHGRVLLLGGALLPTYWHCSLSLSGLTADRLLQWVVPVPHPAVAHGRCAAVAHGRCAGDHTRLPPDPPSHAGLANRGAQGPRGGGRRAQRVGLPHLLLRPTPQGPSVPHALARFHLFKSCRARLTEGCASAL